MIVMNVMNVMNVMKFTKKQSSENRARNFESALGDFPNHRTAPLIYPTALIRPRS